MARDQPGLLEFLRRDFAAEAAAEEVEICQLGARFLPELNAIAAGLAGATKVSITRFVCYGAVSALTWAGGWIRLRYVLSRAVTETAAHLGIRLIVFFFAAFALYLPFHRVHRHRLIRVFRQARLSPDDVATRVENGARVSTPLLPLAHSSGKEDAQASEALAAPSQGESQDLDRMSDVPPDLIDMVGRWPHP